MRFKDELTFDDVFIVPQLSSIGSRFDVDITPNDDSGNTIPIVISNMNALSGSKLAATVANRGGVSILSQDLSPEELQTMIQEVQYGTKMEQNTDIESKVRDSIYTPNLNSDRLLNVGVAVGINGDYAAKIDIATSMGVNLIVVDTAHGHQQRMLDEVNNIRSKYEDIIIVAGNVVTAEGVKDLAIAGANIIKSGLGNGGQCATRMVTGVGRPQFSAIQECAIEADAVGVSIWADGGIKNPRDVALALAAGADNVMIGSLFVGTYESPGQILLDEQGNAYKINYGMASKRAVTSRNVDLTEFDRIKREMFDEGTSESRIYINPARPGAEDVIDWLTTGLRSSMSYTGARNIQEFQSKVIIGTQTNAGFREGKPIDRM